MTGRMQKFSYYNPTRIHFGKHQIEKIATELSTDTKVLFVYGGGSIKNNGVYQQVMDALAEHTVVEFAGISSNPKYEEVESAAELAREQKIDFILAVGGGSVIDASKHIAAAILYEGDSWDFFTGKAKVERAVPLGCVLTLPATGSESNAGTVITRGQDKLSMLSDWLRPQFAILDPSVTFSLPERQVANGVVDAFVHVCEQYITLDVEEKSCPIQERYSEAILKTLVEEGLKVRNHPEDLAIRENIMWAANQALNGLIGVGVPQDWSTHVIGHELTGLYGIDHARTLSIVMPALWKVRKLEKSEKLSQYSERVWGITCDDVDQKIGAAIRKTEEFFVEMEMPIRLSDVGLDAACIEPILASLETHRFTKLGEDSGINLEMVRQILVTALD